ncbi:MAG TPA: type II CAAX endopeptidase family protein [Candidatus Acidoferrum sp.]|nr:type II CAAX endopeptidase family protein [Candidatus Acidoferrum sp.]
MKRQVWLYLILAYAFTWLIWITAGYFGIGPDHGEYIAAFGVAGPALAAVFLSRRGQDASGERLYTRLLSFAVLWLFAWAIYIVNDKLRGIHAPTSLLYYATVGLLAAIPAWILSGAFTRDSGVRELLRALVHPGNWRWQAASFFFWPAMLLIPAVITYLFHRPLNWPRHRDSVWLSAAFGGISFLNNFLFTAALEEPGWRGFLLPRLQQRFSPLLASLLVWFPWALWHAPLDFHRPFRFTLLNYLLIRVVFLIPITIILTWFYNRSGANLLSVVIFHAAMNTFPFVLPNYPPAYALVILFAIIVIFTDRMWRLRSNSSTAANHVPEPGIA